MGDIDEVVRQTTLALLRLPAETAGRTLATQLIRRYESLTPEQRTRWFTFLAEELGPDRTAVDRAIAAYQAEPDESHLVDLAEATESLRRALFRALNAAPGGTSTLLDIRARLIDRRGDHPGLEPLERDLTRLLSSWFNRGFLELRELGWTTPAHILEKLIDYEAVHEIRGWDDLRRRLAPDRRSFGFFHPALPDEPIIYVTVALTQGMASSIQAVIDAPPPDTEPGADTAIFYSITNCQPGLLGISFGSSLIKRVTRLLAAEIPRLTTFATLSPIPGFAAWLAITHPETDTDDPLAMEHRCAQYLLTARQGDLPRDLPLDPVARFHLRNGARVERINWHGDTSAKGMAESHGLLVNYRYSGQDLSANHDALVQDGLVIASPEVIALAGSVDPGLVAEAP